MSGREHSVPNRAHTPAIGEEWNPGEGWVEVAPSESVGRERIRWGGPANTYRTWVRVPPVPPLPTVPYTVIRVAWGDSGPTWPNEFVLRAKPSPGWFPVDCDYQGPAYELDPITSFEVLSEPRAVTAKAVLDHVRDVVTYTPLGIKRLDDIAREFGVES